MYMLSLFESILPIELIIKIVLIIILGLVTVLGAFFVPKGKFVVIIGGIIAILVVWYIDFSINL